MSNPRARLDELYARIPKLACQRKCGHSCGPLGMSRAEYARLAQRHGQLLVCNQDLSCPLLNQAGECSAYEIRPLLCRLYGVVRAMACPHGCEPERWLTDEESEELLRLSREIGGGFVMILPEVP